MKSGPHSTRPSLPSSSGEPSLRRLGVGNASSERPVRAQLVVALMVVVTIVAVPLYLMRRPSPHAATSPAADAGVTDAGKPLASAAAAPVVVDAGKPPERLRLAPPQRVRCGATPKGAQEGNLCDQLAPLEEALAKTIRETETCAFHPKEATSINYVMNVDFTKRKLHLFPGASGDLRGPRARRSTNCIERALPKPDWESLRHQFRYYTIAVLATYQPDTPAPPAAPAPTTPNPTGTPRFD
jgi:hypothetical protein